MSNSVKKKGKRKEEIERWNMEKQSGDKIIKKTMTKVERLCSKIEWV